MRRPIGLLLFAGLAWAEPTSAGNAAAEIATNVVWTVAPSRGAEIPDPYATLLRQAGWLEYVVSNIDQLDFVRSDVLVLRDGRRAVGVAMVRRGRRMAQVAILDRSALDIAATIVHEAAHLEPWRGSRRMGTQAYAYQTEARFLASARSTRSVAITPGRLPRTTSSAIREVLTRVRKRLDRPPRLTRQ